VSVDETDRAAAAIGPNDVLAVWRAAGPKKWFTKDADFDAQIAARFMGVWQTALAGKLAGWEKTPESALALVILLDQFPRNMFRGQSRAFEADAQAHAVADRAIARGFDQRVPLAERMFFYLPFEHSEKLADQERCIALMRTTGDADLVKWAELHADIIRRFGRFPHRNEVFARATTPEEQAFLDADGFAG
jgi:uncharacterized protein (DUF924 family)